jgi:FkbM family methyltransferase
VWEPHLHRVFKQFITKDHTVLEAGCHIGSHSILLAKLSKELICFEPFSCSADILEHNLRLNKCNNATVYKKALSDSNLPVICSYLVHGNPGNFVFNKDPQLISSAEESYQVSSITIDELQLEQLHFIKLDTEEYEAKIIQGGWETIKKFKPIITLECYENDQGKYSLSHTEATFSNLIDIGYSIFHIHGPDFLFLPPT